MENRYLTKSRFKTGLECPTKLFYTGKAGYANQSLNDSFLEALAQGGYQVGELAKHYFPGGHDIKTLDYQSSLEQTQELLERDQVIIYEAAVRFQNLFIRIDVLVKDGNRLVIHEVKAKSYDAEKDSFFKKRGVGLAAKWAPYLYDVAFQHFVVRNAFPEMTVDGNLMLVDKTVRAATDGLNTKFKIVKAGQSRKEIEVADTLNAEDLEVPLLKSILVNDVIEYIYQKESFNDSSFESHIAYLESIYQKDDRVQGDLKSTCKQCEFHCSDEDKVSGLNDGRKECWSDVLGWNESDFLDPLVTDIWNFRGVDKLIAQNKFKLIDVEEGDIDIKSDDLPGLSKSQRQWLQIEKAQNRDPDYFLDIEGLRNEMNSWVFPLHFIDFETTAPALPFLKDMRPYEGIAFQFSHHIVYEDGRVEHAGQFLDTGIGHFPNIDFVRALKVELEKDSGTIFRYSNHENTYLNQIFWQIKESQVLADSEKVELGDFIKSITHSTEKSSVKWKGRRDMVDLWVLVKRYYYDPYTHGSNSIKYVLPAILNSSDYLKSKYSKPIYGVEGGIPSLNFPKQQWVKMGENGVIDPYQLLPTLFEDMPDNVDELLSDGDDIKNGGAAMTAYAKMQFTDMSDYERENLEAGLLKYCELDTLAMVMIYEAWREWIKQPQSTQV